MRTPPMRWCRHGRWTAPSRSRAPSPATSTSSTLPRSVIALERCARPISAPAVRPRRSPPRSRPCVQSLATVGSTSSSPRLRVHPVFTAHPTEARRRAVTSALRRVGDQLERLAAPGAAEAPQLEIRRRLLEEIDGLWRTAQLRSQELQPLDEVRTLMSVFDETLFRLVPAVYRELSGALDTGEAGAQRPAAPAFLRFGSWVGGDRDGNPHITAHVTRETMLIQSEHILRGLEAAAIRIGSGLTADAETTMPDQGFLARLRSARETVGGRAGAIEARSPGEPYPAVPADRGRANRGHPPGRSLARLFGTRRIARRPPMPPGCTGASRRSSAGIRRAPGPHLAGADLRLPPRRSRDPPAQRRASQRARRARAPRARAPRRPTRWWRRCAPSRCCSNGSARASVIATW